MTTLNTSFLSPVVRPVAFKANRMSKAQPQVKTPLFGNTRRPMAFDEADNFTAVTRRKYALLLGFDVSGAIRPTTITTGKEGITIKDAGWLGLTTESYTMAYSDFDLVTMNTNPLFAKLKFRVVAGPFKGREIVLSHLGKADAQKLKNIADKYSNGLEHSRLWIQRDEDDIPSQ